MKRSCRFLAVLLPMLATGLASAQDPAVVVWTPSLDAFTTQVGQLLSQIGQKEAGDRFADAVRTKLGAKGFAGIDPARPIGAFLKFNPDPAGAIVVPIRQEAEFLNLLERLDMKATREADGVYRLAAPTPLPVYAKVVGDVALITGVNKNGLAGAVDARTLFPTPAKNPPIVAARVRIDALPRDARQLAISHFEDSLQQAMKKDPAATAAQKAFSQACNQAIAGFFAQILEEGQSLSLDVRFDAPAESVSTDFRLTARPGSALAKWIADAGQSPTFATLQTGAVAAQCNLGLPDGVVQAFVALVDESLREQVAGFRDADKKRQAEEFYQALKPTLEAGRLDAQFRLVGPDAAGKFGAAVGLAVKQGDRLGTAFMQLITDAQKTMSDAEKAKIQLDAEAAGGLAIHRFQLPVEGRRGPDVFGDSTLSIAFRDNAVFAGIGSRSLAAIKEMAAAAPASPSPLFRLNVDVAKAAPLLGAPARPDERGTIVAEITGGDARFAYVILPTSAIRFFQRLRATAEK